MLLCKVTLQGKWDFAVVIKLRIFEIILDHLDGSTRHFVNVLIKQKQDGIELEKM